MPTDFISMAPAPALVRAALAHCEIPLDYTDEGGVRIPAGPGFDSNGLMTIPEGHVLRDILSAVLTTAMVKHMEDTMVLPTNVARLRAVAHDLGHVLDDLNAASSTDHIVEILEDAIESLTGVASNLDPAMR
jgi:hypothetical protein